jgi:HK97 family phage prohead protease
MTQMTKMIKKIGVICMPVITGKPFEFQPERRIIEMPVEMRAAGDNSRMIRGTAAVIGAESRMLGGWFKEIVEPGAFEGCDFSDVAAVKNHDRNLILARVINGSGTLKLVVNENGLHYEFEAPDTTTGNDLLVEVRRGDIQHSSYMFIVGRDFWTVDPDGIETRHIEKLARVMDVSPVVDPGYYQTNVDARMFEVAKRSFETKRNETVTNVIRRNIARLNVTILKHKYQ